MGLKGKLNILGLFCLVQLSAQNLVPNPGFEEYKKCPQDYTIRHRKELIPGWIMPTLGTADYFNICSQKGVGIPQNFMGYCFPKEGSGYAGFILLFEPPDKGSDEKQENYREYLQVALKNELQRGKDYEITFFYSVALYSTFAINRIGVHLSAKKEGNLKTSGILKLTPHLAIDTVGINKQHYQWYEFKKNYKATGGEKYLTIGNFYSDNETNFEYCDFSELSAIKKTTVIKDRIAYYYIDQVSVVEIQ